MPTGNNDEFTNPVVLVRNDALQAYDGRRIADAYDYGQLLEWLAYRYPGETACLHVYNSLMPIIYDLFLPSMGYVSLTGMLPLLPRRDFPLWMDGNTGEIKTVINMRDSVTDAFWRFYEWLQKGWVTFAEYHSYFRGEELPDIEPLTILTHSHYVSALRNIDMGRYTAFVFREPTTVSHWRNQVAIAAPGSDISEYLRFMEWAKGHGNGKVFDNEITGRIYHDYFRREIPETLYEDGVYWPLGMADEIRGLEAPVYPLSVRDSLDLTGEILRNSDLRGQISMINLDGTIGALILSQGNFTYETFLIIVDSAFESMSNFRREAAQRLEEMVSAAR
jgi:hypothetical protein